MRKIGLTLGILVVIAVAVTVIKKHSPEAQNLSSTPTPTIVADYTIMEITSPAFGNNQEIPAKYTCDGKDVNPPLSFVYVPAEAKSLVLIMDDPDAPGGTWVHWILYDISRQTKSIAEHSIPAGAEQGITIFGKIGYGGPCPPSGTHHYHFKLYALDTQLSFISAPKKADVEQAMKGHILAQDELIGLYSKK